MTNASPFMMLDGKGKPTQYPVQACGWAFRTVPVYAGPVVAVPAPCPVDARAYEAAVRRGRK